MIQHNPFSFYTILKESSWLLLCYATARILVVFVASGPFSSLWISLTSPCLSSVVPAAWWTQWLDTMLLCVKPAEEAELVSQLKEAVIYDKSITRAINIRDEFSTSFELEVQLRRYKEKKSPTADNMLLWKCSSDCCKGLEIPSVHIFPMSV